MSEGEPSRLQGNIKYAQGVVEQAIGATGLVSEDWTASGNKKVSEGTAEVEAAKEAAYKEAVSENISGKIESGIGMVTGNAEKQREGNLKSQQAEIKQAANDPAGLKAWIPNDSEDAKERIEGKVKSAVGLVTGDQQKQTEGNLQDAKANAHDTVSKFFEGQK